MCKPTPFVHFTQANRSCLAYCVSFLLTRSISSSSRVFLSLTVSNVFCWRMTSANTHTSPSSSTQSWLPRGMVSARISFADMEGCEVMPLTGAMSGAIFPGKSTGLSAQYKLLQVSELNVENEASHAPVYFAEFCPRIARISRVQFVVCPTWRSRMLTGSRRKTEKTRDGY